MWVTGLDSLKSLNSAWQTPEFCFDYDDDVEMFNKCNSVDTQAKVSDANNDDNI